MVPQPKMAIFKLPLPFDQVPQKGRTHNCSALPLYRFHLSYYSWRAMTDKTTDNSDARAALDGDSAEPPRFLTVGGLIDETGVSLCIYGDDLIPEEVSQILGVAPTRAHRRGELMRSRSPHAPQSATHRTGVWILALRGQAPREPEELTTALLDQLPEGDGVWVELAARYCIQLRYGLHMEAWNRGFALSPALLTRVARMHAEMDFDIYAYLGDQEE